MTTKENKYKSQFILVWAKKVKAVEYLGGKCIKCGCHDIRVLTFHHPDDNKDFNFCNHRRWTWENILTEIKKCILLCQRCHCLEHVADNVIDNRPRLTKKILLEFTGKNSCEECGWNVNQCGLQFHHKDPKDKVFVFSKIKLKANSAAALQNNIIEEINKCQVLCANCHQIHHISKKFEIYKNEIYKKSQVIRSRPNLNETEIQSLYLSGMTVNKIARLYNVNKGIINYILRKNNIAYRNTFFNKKTAHITKEELENLYNKEHKTWKEIAAIYNVSPTAIKEKKKLLGIIKNRV